MMEMKYQQRAEAKIKWALNCYNDLRDMQLEQPDCDLKILDTNLAVMTTLSKNNFEFVLCRFICEVRKRKEDGDFPGRVLYQMVCALQNYLKKNSKDWKLLHGEEFQNFNRVLDSVMAVGTIKRQAQVISLQYEKNMWGHNILAEDTPDKLRTMVLYSIGINCALCAGDENYSLRRPGGCMSSQISFERSYDVVWCVVYKENCITKTNRGGGGLRDIK